jgi:selenocysteine lyase/cysteine desulfurase
MMPLSVAAAQEHFARVPGYLDTATVGLPPRVTVTALHATVDDWAAVGGRPRAIDEVVAAARASFAALVGVAPAAVAVGANVSSFVGLVAASLPPGAEVVAAEGDFTSLLFPFLAQAERGVVVRLVPLERVAEAVGARTALVAVSAVQSADGRLADLAAITRAAQAVGARTLVDATQAAGWLPLSADRFDYLVAGGYKWLLSPRGTAFLAVRPDALPGIVPHAAGWYAGEHPWESIYGAPLRLAHDARRLDLSPAWLCWAGAAPSLALLEEVGVEAIQRHDVALADRFRAGLGLAPTGSAIVSLDLADAGERLAAAGVAVSARAGRTRLSFHLTTTDDDVDLALGALGIRP